MRIMFLSAIDKKMFGGVESWTTLVAECLANRGHEITIVSRPGSELLRRSPVQHDRVQTIELPITDDFNIITITKIKKLLKRFNIDLLVTNRNKDLRLGGLAARWQGQTKVLWRLGVNLTKRSWLHRTLTPHLFDGIVTPSQDLKDTVLSCGYIPESAVTVIPNAVKERSELSDRQTATKKLREKYNFPIRSKIILTLARLVEEKGLNYLIEAAAAVCSKNQDIRFLILGDGPDRAKLEYQVSKLMLDDKIILPGHLDNYELELAGSNLFVLPSLAESFGNVLLEAMRSSLPIIASRVGGIPEVFGSSEAAILVPPANPEIMSQAINNLITETEISERMGEAGCELYEKQFTPELMTDRLENYVTALIGRG